MSRAAEWNALESLLPHQPDTKQKQDALWMRAYWEWARGYFSLFLGREVRSLKDVTEEELERARRFHSLRFWSEHYRLDEWGNKKLTQILGHEVGSIFDTFHCAPEEELARIEHWMLTGKLPEQEQEAA